MAAMFIVEIRDVVFFHSAHGFHIMQFVNTFLASSSSSPPSSELKGGGGAWSELGEPYLTCRSGVCGVHMGHIVRCETHRATNIARRGDIWLDVYSRVVSVGCRSVFCLLNTTNELISLQRMSSLSQQQQQQQQPPCSLRVFGVPSYARASRERLDVSCEKRSLSFKRRLVVLLPPFLLSSHQNSSLSALARSREPARAAPPHSYKTFSTLYNYYYYYHYYYVM